MQSVLYTSKMIYVFNEYASKIGGDFEKSVTNTNLCVKHVHCHYYVISRRFPNFLSEANWYGVHIQLYNVVHCNSTSRRHQLIRIYATNGG